MSDAFAVQNSQGREFVATLVYDATTGSRWGFAQQKPCRPYRFVYRHAAIAHTLNCDELLMGCAFGDTRAMPNLGRPKCLQSMRKQFHFRWSDSRLLAWDVDGLIELARGLPTEMVPVDLIREIDTNYWFSHHSEPTVRALTTHMRMVNDADLSYPIILDPQGSVLDGMHRVAKALLFEHQFIAARRILTLSEPDYVDVLPEDLPIE